MTPGPADYPHRLAFLKEDRPDAPVHVVIVEPGQGLANATVDDMRNAVATRCHVVIAARTMRDLEEAIAAFADVSATTGPAVIQ